MRATSPNASLMRASRESHKSWGPRCGAAGWLAGRRPRKKSTQSFYSNKRSRGGASLVDVTVVDAVVSSILREYVVADRLAAAIEAVNTYRDERF